MNKHILKVLESYDLSVEGHYAYGSIEGYEVNVFENPMAAGPVFFFSTYLTQTNKALFITKLNGYKYSLVKAEILDYGLAIMIGCATGGSFEKKAPEVLGTILSLLSELEAPKKDICPVTGQPMDEMNSKVITTPNTNCKIQLSNEAIDAINSSIENANENYEQAANNYLKGFFGILIGAIVGVIISFVLSLLGIVAAISSIASIGLGVFLYKKFGGKPNAVMIVMSLVTTAVFICGYVFGVYLLVAKGYMIEWNLPYTGMEAFKYCMNNDAEFKSAFLREFGMSILFMVIGEACTIGYLVRSIKRPQKVN